MKKIQSLEEKRTSQVPKKGSVWKAKEEDFQLRPDTDLIVVGKRGKFERTGKPYVEAYVYKNGRKEGMFYEPVPLDEFHSRYEKVVEDVQEDSDLEKARNQLQRQAQSGTVGVLKKDMNKAIALLTQKGMVVSDTRKEMKVPHESNLKKTTLFRLLKIESPRNAAEALVVLQKAKLKVMDTERPRLIVFE